MSSEWPRLKVHELQASGTLLVEDGNHGEYRPRPDEFAIEGTSFIRAADMADGRVLFKSAERINDIARARVRKGIGQPGDVLLSHKGTVGKVAFVESNCPDFVCSPQTTFWRVLDESVIDRRYLFAYLQSHDFKVQLASRKGETDMADYVSLTAQRQLSVPLPSIGVQRAIGDYSAMFADRITLLRETNTTLEAIAQALFKSWFVDFDPVRAKVAGRAPEGMDEATAALFPDSFEDSELGEVPRGWGIGSVASVARLHKSTVNPAVAPERWFQHFSLPAYDEGQMPLMQQGAEIKSNKTSIPTSAVLLSKLNPHIPRVWLPSSISAEAVCSTEFLVFVPSQVATTSFVYSLLSAPDFCGRLCQLVTGTSNSHQRVKPDSVLSLPQVVPDPACIRAYDSIVDGLYARLRQNRETSQQLAALRDTLLPRLISGQLRLPEATEAVDHALATTP